MRIPVWMKTAGVLVLVALAACGKRTMTRPPLALPPECGISLAPAKAADSLTVALFDVVEPKHAPWARNAGERLLFGNLYETLIVVDCLGDVRPGLAAAWRKEKRGRRWVFALREDARFWDGTPVTADDVVASCQDALTLDTAVDSITAGGDGVVIVYLERRHRHVPRALSAPLFAVAKASGDSDWLVGTGPYRIVSTKGRPGDETGGSITAVPAFDGRGPVVRFLETSVYDARDLLEGEIDVLVTTDPDVIEYAAGRPQLSTTALPWDKTYVLLSTTRFEKIRRGEKPAAIPTDLSDKLARDAVTGDARGYRHPSWWDDFDDCGDVSFDLPWFDISPRGADSASRWKRIVYDARDPVARDLAERIVALAATDPATSAEAAAISDAIPGLTGGGFGVTAVGVTGAELRSSIRTGGDFAYVIPIPKRPADPCFEASEMMRRMPWLSVLGSDFADAMLPLVDTRPYLIANHDRAGLAVDWYGTIFIGNRKLEGR